jgi:glucokinase
MHVANLAIAVDPSVISVGGGLMGAADSILPVLQNAVQAAVPFPPRIVPAHFRYDAALHGAAAMALDHLAHPSR